MRREKYATDGGRTDRKSRNLKQNYGITLEQYFDICKAQIYRCAICGEPEPRGLVVDHCHATNKVRELLCDACNRGLGSFKDKPEVLEKAAKYLRRHGKP